MSRSRDSSPERAQEPTKAMFPEKFSGENGQAQLFVTQVDIGIEVSPNRYTTDKQKILYTVSHFRGKALNWIRPILMEYLHMPQEDWEDETTAIFSSYDNLTAKMIETFEDKDVLREAIRNLQRLKQTGSISAYNAIFQQNAFLANWDDEALAGSILRRVERRDKIRLSHKRGKPEDLIPLKAQATEIGNLLNEQSRDRRFTGRNYNYHTREKPKKWVSDPMDLDSMETRRKQASVSIVVKRTQEERMPRESTNGRFRSRKFPRRDQRTENRVDFTERKSWRRFHTNTIQPRNDGGI